MKVTIPLVKTPVARLIDERDKYSFESMDVLASYNTPVYKCYNKSTGAVYLIVRGEQCVYCTCSGFFFNRACKHIDLWENYLNTQKPPLVAKKVEPVSKDDW